MAVRIRSDGTILCAAMHPKRVTDIYIDDNLHYYLSVEARVLVTEPHHKHKEHGEWWWVHKVPEGKKIDKFYLKDYHDE